jgi:prepilin-type N-terminal cleavage/methylation domain-containing protein
MLTFGVIFSIETGMINTRSLRKVQGYTLIELLVVILVLGIIAGLAIPRLGEMVARQRLDNASRQISQDIGFARMTAVRNGQSTRVVIEANRYRLFRGAETAPFRTVNFNVDYPGVSATPRTLTFNSRGMLQPAQGVSVTLTRAGRTKQFQILPTGRVYRAQ